MKNKIIIVLVLLVAAGIGGILENSDTLGKNYKSKDVSNKLETVKATKRPIKKINVVTNKENELLADKAKKLIIEKEAELEFKGVANIIDTLQLIDHSVLLFNQNKSASGKFIVSTYEFSKDKSKISVELMDEAVDGTRWCYVPGTVKVIKR